MEAPRAADEGGPKSSKGKGRERSEGTWRPVLDPHTGAEFDQRGVRQSVFANQAASSRPSTGKGHGKGSHQGKGRRGKGGKNTPSCTYTEEYFPTGVWGSASAARPDLEWWFPNDYD